MCQKEVVLVYVHTNWSVNDDKTKELITMLLFYGVMVVIVFLGMTIMDGASWEYQDPLMYVPANLLAAAFWPLVIVAICWGFLRRR